MRLVITIFELWLFCILARSLEIFVKLCFGVRLHSMSMEHLHLHGQGVLNKDTVIVLFRLSIGSTYENSIAYPKSSLSCR